MRFQVRWRARMKCAVKGCDSATSVDLCVDLWGNIVLAGPPPKGWKAHYHNHTLMRDGKMGQYYECWKCSNKDRKR